MNREIWPTALVAPEDYESFRRLLGADVPDTYDEWLQLHRKDILENAQAGRMVKESKIDLDEFTRYCSSRHIPTNGANLMHFMREKAAGQTY